MQKNVKPKAKPRGKPFQPGRPPGPGRPKGSLSGRSQALAILDEVYKEVKVKEALKKAIREKALANPLGTFMKIVVPLLPKEATIDIPESTTINVIFRKNGNGNEVR